MPESPCLGCKTPTPHADGEFAFCARCEDARRMELIFNDICEGRLVIPLDEEGNPILLNEQGESVL